MVPFKSLTWSPDSLQKVASMTFSLALHAGGSCFCFSASLVLCASAMDDDASEEDEDCAEGEPNGAAPAPPDANAREGDDGVEAITFVSPGLLWVWLFLGSS